MSTAVAEIPGLSGYVMDLVDEMIADMLARVRAGNAIEPHEIEVALLQLQKDRASLRLAIVETGSSQ